MAVATWACTTADRYPPRPPRVILFSWDGAAHWLTATALERTRLPGLERLLEEGAWADGMVSSFPTKTAAAHAMLWTGRHGHENGITANSILLTPADEHTRLETRSGFFSDGLTAEPIWIATARAGMPTYALHATQAYPFAGAERWARREELDSLQMLHGYTRISGRARVLSEQTDPMTPAADWAIAAADDSAARQVSLSFGDELWWGVFYDDPVDPTDGLDTLGLTPSREATSFEILLKPGLDAAASAPVAMTRGETRLPSTLRLFDLDPWGETYLLYISSAERLAAFNEFFSSVADLAEEPFAGNGGGWAYQRGEFGRTIPQGGDGLAEDRFLVTLADVAAQFGAQARWVFDRGDYRLAILYSSVLDDAAHAWVGYLDPSMPGHDPLLAERLWPKMEAAYRLNDDLLQEALDAAERDGANLLLVSDHGMAGTNRLLNVNVALENAGLLTTTRDGEIDLERTRALLLPTSDASIAVNTVDRPGGIVPLPERDAVLEEIRRALEALREPQSGRPLITAVYSTSTTGQLQPGGVTTGDLFPDVPPGYYFSDRLANGELVSETEPSGNHGFVPTRPEMLAICGGWGPAIEPQQNWSRVNAIDVAPTILQILGLEAAADLPGSSLVRDAGERRPSG